MVKSSKKKDHARAERGKLIKIKEMQKVFQDKCRAKNRKKKMEMRKRRYEKKLKALIEQRELGFAENGTGTTTNEMEILVAKIAAVSEKLDQVMNDLPDVSAGEAPSSVATSEIGTNGFTESSNASLEIATTYSTGVKISIIVRNT